MNEMELQTTLDPIEMDMGDPEIIYSPVLPNPEGDPTDDLTKVTIQGNIYQIKDPEVHEWARAEEKPTYTKEEVGLGNVDNTSDMNKPVSTATQTALNNKVDKVAGKGLSTNDFTNDFKTKLEGIEAGAEVNTVNSVAGKTGNVTLNKSDVGLSNVDNTSDLNKPISTATQSALNGKVNNSTLNNYYTKTETDTALGNKVDKVQGKGLSENDFTDTLKDKLDGIEEQANKTVVDNSVTATSTNPVESKAIYNLLNDLLPEAEATGNPIATTNASGFNAKALTVDMLPIQDLHGYDKPWAGGSGKNKCNDTTISVGYYNANGVYDSNEHYRTSDLIPVEASTQYSTSLCAKNDKTRIGGLVVTLWDSNSNFIEQVTTSPFTTTSETAFVRVRNFQSQTDYIDNNNFLFQIEKGATYTSFAPYSNICPISGRTSIDVTVNGETKTLNLGQTVYGGTCDVVNGGTSDEWEIVDLSTLDWNMSSYGGLTQFASSGISSLIKISITINSEPFNGKCTIYETSDRNSLYNGVKDNAIAINVGGVLWITDQRYASATDFKNSLHGVYLCYEKATPTTITTPETTISLNKGNNTLSTSGDNMDLKYSTTISNPTPSLSMARPSLGMIIPTIDSTEDTRLLDNANIEVVEEPTEE